MIQYVFKFAIMLTIAVIAGCSESTLPNDVKNDSVTLALNWFPDSQHGGFYAADHFGFFEDEGIKVKIEPGGPGAPVVQNVGLGRVAFAVGNADQILMAREQQVPIVALMASMQNSPRCLMVHKETGITNFDQLADITLALGAGKAFVKFLQRDGVLDKVQVVNYTGSIAPFLADVRFGQQAYVFSEPYVAEEHGAHPVCMMVSELGFNPYTSVLFTSDQVLQENPQLVEKMVRAVRRGWLAYLKDPEPVNKRIHQDNPEMDLEALNYGAKAIAPLCLPEGTSKEEIGTMSESRWQTLKEQMVAMGFVSEKLATQDAYLLKYVRSMPAATNRKGEVGPSDEDD